MAHNRKFARRRRQSLRHSSKHRGLEDLSDQYAPQVLLRRLDVTDFGAAQAAVNTAVERFGRLDVVANVAGYGSLGPIENTRIEGFRAQIDTNLFEPIHLSKAAIP